MVSIDDKNPLAILAPNEWEAKPIWNAIKNGRKSTAGIVPFVEGTIAGIPVVAAMTYSGKIYAASSTQKIVDTFSPGAIILCGACGGLDLSLKRGMIVLADRVIEHDAGWWLTTGFQHLGTMGFDAQGNPRTYMSILPDQDLITIAHKVLPDAHLGTLVSGDQAIFNSERREYLRQSFNNAIVVEMEGSSVAAVAHSNKIPFLIIRSIGDMADAETGLDEGWFANLEIYSDQNTISPLKSKFQAVEQPEDVKKAWQQGAIIAAEATISIIRALT